MGEGDHGALRGDLREPCVKRTVLVFRIGQLGDTLIALPAIAAIHERHRHDRLVLLTERYPDEWRRVSAWDVLGPTGWFDEVIYYRPAVGLWRKAVTVAWLLGRLRVVKPDVIYDLAPERSVKQIERDRAFFARLVGCRQYHSGSPLPKFGRGPDGVLPRIEPEWRRLLAIAGASPHPDRFRLAVPYQSRARVRKQFEAMGMHEGTRILAIGPGSKMPAKRWSVERFGEVGCRLMKEDAGLRLIVLGGSEDVPIGDVLCQRWGRRAQNFSGQWSVYESAAALERCRGYLGNDTGTMHLAAMVGVPCVALFSARDYPGQWEPYGQGHVVLREETDCAGCMLEVCRERDNECLQRIGEEKVVEAVRRLLDVRPVSAES